MMDFWEKLTLAGKIITTILLIAFIGLLVFLLVYFINKNHKKESSSNPEVAQVYEPSISSPLPPDINPDAKTDQVSTTATVNPPGQNPQVAGDSTTNQATTMIAPKTGVDPNDPIPYENKELMFAATLPAGTNVTESDQTATFTSKTNSLEFMVSVSEANNETLQTIENQLQNSPEVSNASLNSSRNSIIFTDAHFGQGMVVIKNKKVYYLLGEKKYFSTIKF